jgi:NAD+ kinase
MRIHILGSVHQTTTRETLQQILTILTHHLEEDEVVVDSRFYSHLLQEGLAPEGVKTLPLTGTIDTDILVCIGGDGTFLRGAKLVAGTSAGVLGINSGHLGFLSSMQPEELSRHWEEIRSGQCQKEERTTLEATVLSREGTTLLHGVALNEVAVTRRNMVSMITITTIVDGERMVDYQADGLLVATPTGSSAYALSVGGPLIYPDCSAMLITPIAPHSLTMRPVLIPDTMTVELSVSSRSGTFAIALDGRSKDFPDSSTIIVKKSDKRVRILHTGDYRYFDNLRKKLMWGADTRLELEGSDPRLP